MAGGGDGILAQGANLDRTYCRWRDNSTTHIRRELYPVITWMTPRTDYEEFREKYGDFE